jgi:hypothetical protein
MDDAGLTAAGCDAARWFEAKGGLLLAARARSAGVRVTLRPSESKDLRPAAAFCLDWKTGRRSTARVAVRAGEVVFDGLDRGLNLIVVPRR